MSSKFNSDLTPASRHPAGQGPAVTASSASDAHYCFSDKYHRNSSELHVLQNPTLALSAAILALAGLDGKEPTPCWYLQLHLEEAAPEVLPQSVRLGRGQGGSTGLSPPTAGDTAEAKQGRPALKQQQWAEGKHQNLGLSCPAFFQPSVQQARKKTGSIQA